MTASIPSMDELFRLYTIRYSHVDIENGERVLYQPMSIATTPEMKEIIASSVTVDECLTRMHWLVGTPGPKFANLRRR